MPQGAAVTVVVIAGSPSRAEALTGAGLELAGHAAGAAAAAQLVSHARPQAVVVDLDGDHDGGGAGVQAIGAVVRRAPAVPVLAVCGPDDHATVLAAVRAGASGYLASPAGAEEVAAAVRRTAAGEAVFSPGLAEVVLETYGRLTEPAGPGPVRLTERESDVLQLVVEGLTARQIATRLVLSPRTVENHVQHVLRKLRVHNRAALVRYAIEHGLA